MHYSVIVRCLPVVKWNDCWRMLSFNTQYTQLSLTYGSNEHIAKTKPRCAKDVHHCPMQHKQSRVSDIHCSTWVTSLCSSSGHQRVVGRSLSSLIPDEPCIYLVNVLRDRRVVSHFHSIHNDKAMEMTENEFTWRRMDNERMNEKRRQSPVRC